jgi:hypothetical protein
MLLCGGSVDVQKEPIGIRVDSVASWGDVALFVLVSVDATDARLAFRFPCGEVWDAGAILGNLRFRLNVRLLREELAERAGLAHAERLREWMQHTRAIAVDVGLVYGDRIAGLLQQAADEVEQAVSWLGYRLENPPKDPAAVVRTFTTIDLWAFDLVRATLESAIQQLNDRAARAFAQGLPGKDDARVRLLAPALTEVQLSPEALKQRVRRLGVRPGEAANLMADVLDACRRGGPYDRDGRDTTPKNPCS